MPASPQSSLSVSDDTDDEGAPRQPRGRGGGATREPDKCEESDVSLSFPASSDDEGGARRSSLASQHSKSASEAQRHSPVEPVEGGARRSSLASQHSKSASEAQWHSPVDAVENGARHSSLASQHSKTTSEAQWHSPTDAVGLPHRGPSDLGASAAAGPAVSRPSSPTPAEATWATDLSLLGPAHTSGAAGGNPLLSHELDLQDLDHYLKPAPAAPCDSPLISPSAAAAIATASAASSLPSPIHHSPSATLAGPPWSPPVPQVPLGYADSASRRANPISPLDAPASPGGILLREDSEGGEDARVRQLVGLLERATEQIRAERARTKGLELENRSLKQQPRASAAAAAAQVVENDSRYMGLQRAYNEAMRRAEKYDMLKQKYRELHLENQMAIEQIAVLRIKCIDMQVALEAERARAPPTPGPPVGPPAAAPPLASPAAPPLPPPPPPPGSQREDPSRELAFTTVGRTGADEGRGRALHPKGGSAQLKATGSAPRPGQPRTRSSSASVAPAAAFPSRTSSPVGRSPRSLSPPVRGRPQRGHSVPSSPKDEVLIHRMIRALSPPPTVSQLGKLVDSMVKELLRNLRLRGVELPLKRIGNCAYTLHDRRLNLSVISDKLVVKVGGGHQDLIEYLHKSKGFRPRPR